MEQVKREEKKTAHNFNEHGTERMILELNNWCWQKEEVREKSKGSTLWLYFHDVEQMNAAFDRLRLVMTMRDTCSFEVNISIMKERNF